MQAKRPESLHIQTKGKAGRLWKLYRELVIKRGMSIEAVANVVDIALDKLPTMEDFSTRHSNNIKETRESGILTESYTLLRGRRRKEKKNDYPAIILLPCRRHENNLQ